MRGCPHAAVDWPNKGLYICMKYCRWWWHFRRLVGDVVKEKGEEDWRLRRHRTQPTPWHCDCKHGQPHVTLRDYCIKHSAIWQLRSSHQWPHKTKKSQMWGFIGRPVIMGRLGVWGVWVHLLGSVSVVSRCSAKGECPQDSSSPHDPITRIS